jgi:glycosyltransferase involved in cell wall biosynthesis
MSAAVPLFSVVVPSRGDPAKLDALLAALEDQTLPRERFEVLLALDGAALPGALAPRLAGLNGRGVSLATRRGPGAARNAGANLARASWLAFTEDDVTPAPDWLAEAAARIERPPQPDVIEGVTLLPGGRPLRVGLEEGLQYLPTTLFVRRSWFERVGGYHEGFFDAVRGVYFREDADLGFSLETLRAVAVREPRVRVTHPEEHPGPWDPVRWAARYEMDPLLARRHPRLFRERIEVHRVGPFRVRRPIVRACAGVVALTALALVLALTGRAAGARLAALGAIACWLPVWAKWRFSPARLPAALVVPFALMLALARGVPRASAWAAARAKERVGTY